ncbi:MAG: amidohydrolase family protein, partial [Bacteroidota bacterium]
NFNPWNNIRTAVTRKTNSGKTISQDERISVATAIESYTMGGAYAEGTEKIKGSIQPGTYADFIIINRDPLATPVEELADIRTDTVVVNGKNIIN